METNMANLEAKTADRGNKFDNVDTKLENPRDLHP